MAAKTIKFTIENITSTGDPVRNSSILSLSRMRCVRSPTSFESKKWSGIRIILTRKSATSEMLMRVFIYSVIQFLVMPTTTTDNNITNCAIRISVTMFTSRFPIPLSTIACVRNGAANCRPLTMPIAISIFIISRR